jgi:hypothetical protein
MTPLLAENICHVMTGNYMREQFQKLKSSGDEFALAQMHHLLAILNSSVSDNVTHSIEQAQRVCGKDGQLRSAGFQFLREITLPVALNDGDST